MTKNATYFYLFMLWAELVSGGCSQNTKLGVAEKILEQRSIADSISQLLLVYNENPADFKSTLFAYEKIGNNWQRKFRPIEAGIGNNGFAAPGEKREGDGKSPTGLFELGQLFSYEKTVDTKMPFMQSTAADKWIDDPGSPDYNRHIRGETDAKSFENLRLKSDVYKYCMVIEYNTRPVEKGRGSAIFFHLGDKVPGSTAGCVAINEKSMQKILKWLAPESNPAILMGNKEILMKGLKK